MPESEFFHLYHLLCCQLAPCGNLQIFNSLYDFKLCLVHHRLLIILLLLFLLIIIANIVVLLKLISMGGLAHLISFIHLLLDMIKLLQIISV